MILIVTSSPAKFGFLCFFFNFWSICEGPQGNHYSQSSIIQSFEKVRNSVYFSSSKVTCLGLNICNFQMKRDVNRRVLMEFSKSKGMLIKNKSLLLKVARRMKRKYSCAKMNTHICFENGAIFFLVHNESVHWFKNSRLICKTSRLMTLFGG